MAYLSKVNYSCYRLYSGVGYVYVNLDFYIFQLEKNILFTRCVSPHSCNFLVNYKSIILKSLELDLKQHLYFYLNFL